MVIFGIANALDQASGVSNKSDPYISMEVDEEISEDELEARCKLFFELERLIEEDRNILIC